MAETKPNPIIADAQRRTSLGMVERQMQRLAVLRSTGQITQLEHDRRYRALGGRNVP